MSANKVGENRTLLFSFNLPDHLVTFLVKNPRAVWET